MSSMEFPDKQHIGERQIESSVTHTKTISAKYA